MHTKQPGKLDEEEVKRMSPWDSLIPSCGWANVLLISQ